MPTMFNIPVMVFTGLPRCNRRDVGFCRNPSFSQSPRLYSEMSCLPMLHSIKHPNMLRRTEGCIVNAPNKVPICSNYYCERSNKDHVDDSSHVRKSHQNNQCCLSEEVFDKPITTMIENTLRSINKYKDKEYGKKSNNEMSPINKYNIWREIVDYSGFNPDSISMKIENDCLVIKGLEEKIADTGSMTITTFEKRIPLPEQFNDRNVKYKFLPGSKIIFETPVLQKQGHDNEIQQIQQDTENRKENQLYNKSIINDEKYVEDGQENGNNDEISHGCSAPTKPLENEEEHFKLINIEGDRDEEEQNDEKTDKAHLENEHTTSDENSFEVLDIEEFTNDTSRTQVLDANQISDIQEMNNEETNYGKDKIDYLTFRENQMILDSPEEIKHNKDDSESEVNEKKNSEENETESCARKKCHEETSLDNDQQNSQKDISTEFQVRFEFPCHDPHSIQLTMDDYRRVLHIIAENNIVTKQIHKIVPIPEEVDELQLKCHFQDGILSVSAPMKTISKRIRQIPIAL